MRGLASHIQSDAAGGAASGTKEGHERGLQKAWTMNYREQFESQVFTRLGGLEMAGEFFGLHPELRRGLKTHSEYHRRKGGAAWKGAAIWFGREARPALKHDFEKGKL